VIICNTLVRYDEEAGGYSCFFGNSNGMAANFKKLNDLALGIWTDKYTESVYIKMAFYNGVGGVFTYVSMRFLFGSTGVLYPPHMVSIESVDFEPYDRPQDIVRLALEIIFLFWIGYNVGKSIIDAWYVHVPALGRDRPPQLCRRHSVSQAPHALGRRQAPDAMAVRSPPPPSRVVFL
jgi:hypothetical protein